jgi:hypothetical protein
VDYKQLFGDLADALNKYTAGAFEGYAAEDIEGLIKDRINEARKFLNARLRNLMIFAAVFLLRAIRLTIFIISAVKTE